MQVEHGMVQGDLRVTADLQLCGLVTGGITVSGGARLLLDGMCAGDLVIEPGGSADVRGMVRGGVINHGHVRIAGSVQGVLGPGVTEFEPGALIGGSPA